MFQPFKKTQGKALEEQLRTTAALTQRSPGGGSLGIAKQWGEVLKSIQGIWWVVSGVKEVPGALLKVSPVLATT